jgi:hypothetical protein
MGARQSGRSKKNPSRPILGIGIAVVGIGVVLLAISIIAGLNPNSPLQAFSKGLRIPVPYVLLLGFGLLVVYALLRPKADVPSDERNDPAFFGSEMTDFVSHLHRTPPEMDSLDVASEGERAAGQVRINRDRLVD